MSCPTCRRKYEGDRTHCDVDFAVLVPAAPADPPSRDPRPAVPEVPDAPPAGGVSTCACSAPVVPGAAECEWCGRPIEAPPVAPAATSTGAGASLRGPWGSVDVGEEPLEIGRGSPTPVIAGALADLDVVSRRHAEIVRHEGAVWLRDVASANGTFVNDHRLEPGHPVLVAPGDAIRLGSSVHLELGAAP
ncbi:FHA domain-containing protein [Actinomycetospora sp. NBRC 106375]|uniref:FHA domain-containing protein n=1 Tax=Actinomycetospora sp. NBRC 106375 TaxID=3032207 RepID=UPI002555E2BB|nr:FHA domain-containing protein [Actinomycetospora sp. NBRC 106375]